MKKDKPQPAENTANLQRKVRGRPFKPGQSGNPKGKPPGAKNFSTKFVEAINKIADGTQSTYEELFIKAILKQSIEQRDARIMVEMWRQLAGAPAQKVDVTSGGEPVSGFTYLPPSK